MQRVRTVVAEVRSCKHTLCVRMYVCLCARACVSVRVYMFVCACERAWCRGHLDDE